MSRLRTASLSGTKALYLLGGLLVLALVALGCPRAGAQAEESAASQPERPNMVFVLTDDMATGDLEHMPKTRRLLADRGASFENAFVTYSLCCPSRATLLRGQYPHNHRVFNNSAPYGGAPRFRELGRDDSTVATWLDDAGYTTAFVGKYMNAYGLQGDTYVPPGWDRWNAFMGAFHANPKMNNNGRAQRMPENTILDSVVSNKASFYARNLEGPFYLQVSTHAPHGPHRYPADLADDFEGLRAPRAPSFNEADVSDKPEWIRSQDRLSPRKVRSIDNGYRERIRSLQTVDAMVGDLVGELRERRILNDTYFVFMSDNGWHYGEHRREGGKWTPYEEALRVPLLVRGPGVPEGASREQLVLNNDLAPTFAELAGATSPNFVDGRSIQPLLAGTPPDSWRSAFLFESWRLPPNGSPAPTYQGVRTRHYSHTRYSTEERELYNLKRDPHQMNSIHDTPNRRLVGSLERRLSALEDCRGAGCRRAEGE